MQHIKKLFKSALVGMTVSVLGVLVLPGLVYALTPTQPTATNGAAAPAASPQDSVCQGVGLASGGSGCAAPAGGVSVDSAIATGLNILSWVVGIAAIIMIIIGGFKYIISGGESGNITSAKNTILYAIIGLVIVALAQFIVQFVLNKTVVPPPAASQSSQHP